MGSSGANYTLAASTSGRAQKKVRTSGDITVNGTSWANLDTGLDLVLTATAGQLIEVGVSCQVGSGAVQANLDVGSLVSSAIVNVWGTNGAESSTSQGVAAWVALASVNNMIGGSIIRAVAAGDLSGGTVTLRFRVRTGSAGNKVFFNAADYPLVVWAINHG